VRGSAAFPTLSSAPRRRSAKGDCPIRWPAAWLSACSCALALAACGGTEEEAAPPPTLPRTVAARLAADADAVAARLEAGDPCGAAESAAALQQTAVGALNRPGQVPDELKEDLGLAVADLVDRAQTECASAQPPPAPPAPPPPPPPATTVDEDEGEEDEDDNGRGKKKGRGKRKGKKND
jgi:hypothetical protein